MKKYRLTAPSFDATELEHVERVLASGWVTQGPMVDEFEAIVAARHEVAHGLAVTSATAALHLAANALGFGPGDEVVVPALTWVTSANCAEFTGARAVFADVDPDTFNLSPEALEAAITPRTRGVVVVHLFGQSAQMDALLDIARRHELRVIEDAACAIGTTWNGAPVGGLGDAGCLSFHPRKTVTTGEGGMLLTNDAGLAERLDALRNHGASGLPQSVPVARPHDMARVEILGYNYRLSDILAAVGVAQMAKLDRLLDERIRLARVYDEALGDVEGIRPPFVADRCGHTYQSYVTKLAESHAGHRNAIMERLAEQGVQTRPGTHAVHRLGYYADKYGIDADAFPAACAGEDTTITLPVYPGMTEGEQAFVVEAVKDALAACR